MKTHSLKPFDDGKYLSEEEALKMLENIPIPNDDSENVSPTKIESNNPTVDLESRIIDLNPADNDAIKTQDDWITYFNARNQIMVSTPDIYQAGKSGNQTLLNSLRKDFGNGWLLTSTTVKYTSDHQVAIIIHNYGSNLVQPIEHNIVISEHQPTHLANVLNNNEGLEYLQALFGTNDNAPQIRKTLHELSSYSLAKIKTWSTKLLERPAERASGFYCLGDKFYVSSDCFRSYYGRSRAVHTNPNPAPKNGGAP